MASLKDVKVKIAGVGKTKQITKAMYMVASAKLRGAQSRIERFRPYAEKFFEVLGHLAQQAEEVNHPLLQQHRELKHTRIVLLTSDRGLCGSLNVSLIAKSLDEARQRAAEGKTVRFACIGKKGRDAIRKTDYEIKKFYTEAEDGEGMVMAAHLGRDLVHDYIALDTDEVILVYPEFRSTGVQVPTAMQLLPIQPSAPTQDGTFEPNQPPAGHPDFLYEPQVSQLLAQLLPTYINTQIYRAMLDTAASENAARMLAMDNATRNCDDLISSLTLLYNKTRQATITSELIDIVSGANAL